MPQQLAQIPVRRTRHPNAWKPVFFQEQPQQQLSILSVFCLRTRLARIRGGYRRQRALWSQAGRKQLESFLLAPWATRRRQDLLELIAKS
jgi:hypothetical protein